MRVLVVSQYYWPETFRINEVVASLRLAGCAVSVLTGQPNYPAGKTFEGYRAAGMGSEQHDGYAIHRVPLCPRGKAKAVNMVFNYLSFVASASVIGPWLLRGQCFDVVFVYGNSPILQAIPGIVLKQLKGAKLVTWVQDLWPQSLEVTGFVRNRHLLSTVGAVVRWIYRRNDLLLVQSRAFVGSVKKMAGNTPVEYHPNPGEIAFEDQVTQRAPALSLAPGFNVVFAGNFGTVQALETVLEAARLLQEHPDIQFTLVGSGARSEWLRAAVAERGLTNVHLPGRFGAEDMPAILAQASALLVTLTRSPILAQTVPSKVQAYLAAGRPIIACIDGEGARVVEEARAGVACPAEDAPALARAVLCLHDTSAEERLSMGAAGRRYYVRHYAPAGLALRLAQRFAALASRVRHD
jgi:glycosyltransferase involved in cell wall biosynthesis